MVKKSGLFDRLLVIRENGSVLAAATVSAAANVPVTPAHIYTCT